MTKHANHHSIVFAGFGGQGVMFVGQLLSYAAMDAGFHVTWIPSYGPEMRGGTANCYVVVSDHQIGSPLEQHPEIAVVFNLPSFHRFEPLIAPGGVLIVNTSLISETSNRTDIERMLVPATEIASSLGSRQLTNMVLLGALLQARAILPLDAIKTSLELHLPAHRRNLLAKNFEALERGAACAIERTSVLSA